MKPVLFYVLLANNLPYPDPHYFVWRGDGVDMQPYRNSDILVQGTMLDVITQVARYAKSHGITSIEIQQVR